MIDLTNIRGKQIILDANLLIVYVCGMIRSIDLGRQKPVLNYTIDDFELLVRLVRLSGRCVTTPSIIAEASNLLGKPQKYYTQLYRTQLSKMLPEWREEYHQSTILFGDSDQVAIKFGLADKSILELARKGVIVFTDDDLLADLLGRQHLPVFSWIVAKNIRDYSR